MTLSSPATWTTVEPGVGIIAACLPRLKPLLERLLPGTRSSVSDSRNYSRQLDSGHSHLTAQEESGWEMQDVERKPGQPRVSEVDGAEDTHRYETGYPAEIVTAIMHKPAF